MNTNDLNSGEVIAALLLLRAEFRADAERYAGDVPRWMLAEGKASGVAHAIAAIRNVQDQHSLAMLGIGGAA